MKKTLELVAQMPFTAALLRSAGRSFPEGIRRFTETPLHQNTLKPIWATGPLRLTLAVAWTVCVAITHAAELNVYAAASLSDVLMELSVNYEKQTGDKLVFNLGASSMLARQIQEGAPADVFFSADEEKMDGLERKGLLLAGTRKSLLSNSLVIIVPGDASQRVNSALDLTNAAIARIAIAEPKSVPAGIYAKQYLGKLGLWDKLVDKCVPTENVRAALAAVESGNADAGIVYKTDARISKKVRVACEVPVAEGPKISYPVAVLRESKRGDAAKKFVAYLASDATLQVFRKYGFLIGI